MKSIYFSSLLVLLFISVKAQDSQTIDNTTEEQQVSNWLGETNVPGIAILKIENGNVAKTIVKGIDGNGNKITNSTLFDVASLTKTITTLTALKLVENGNLDLDEPLYKYWIDPDVQEDSRHQKLTSRIVLSHRSGFKNWRYMYEDKKLSFDFEPGEKVQYSGEGFEYLRNALEHKFDTPLEKLSDSLLFKPIGMENSAFVWNKKMESFDFAGSHDKEGKAYEYQKTYEANAADNLLTTLSDFGKLSAALLNNSYLKNTLFEEMGQPHSEVREGIDFGLGWIVFQNLPNEEYALFNAGSDQGVNSLVVLLPKSKTGLVVMTNGDNGRGLAMKAIKVFLNEPGGEILRRF
ncbi:serine hydrolase domain-containing protein [Flagellimonas meridianipacifica]|uniref:CubicO group peptidase (Beta-lactamase class C family) n=1 Tax=Flagellimonas meridianipacifica TaxID=1080225 RepID=A0A2T0M9L7_9FLAO|nr:serine hydrolase domain-containing protein [Allomuricauda pacifica]PRX54170.1 CubicO group peptidase (beta-lactamase class C family) [Allomuricauda pacifica]